MSAVEEQFLFGADVVIGTVKHLREDEHNQLLVEVMSGEALTTPEIEGEILNRDSVQSSIQRQLVGIFDSAMGMNSSIGRLEVLKS
jgi:hypothetical protein